MSNSAPAAKNSRISMNSSEKPAPGSTRTRGTISSALRRRRPPCAATAWRSTRLHSGRGCCGTSLRSTGRPRYSAAACLPVMIAPVGALEIFDPDSGAAVARGAGHFGAAHMLSSVSEPGLEATAQAAPDALRIYQLYVRGDDAFVEDVVSRSIDNGYAAFCLTVDTAHYSRRERDIAKRYVRESRIRATGGDFQKGLDWRTVRLIKDKYKIPLVIKGIATAEDAAIALDHGVDWIYVSNHGGRQLDHGRGSMHVLPEIVDAVAGRAKIMVDGSFCRGTDIVKAIAAGADLVGIGRLQCWALAAAGEAGIVRMLELLEDEVMRCLGLLGVTSFAELDESYLHAATPTNPPSVFSAFPLLDIEPYRY